MTPPPADDARPAVLYVDDEPANLRVFELGYRHRFRVLTRPSGEAALALLATPGHGVGVLLTDQRMPGMCGVDLLERAREVDPGVARMVVTAYSDMQVVVDAVNRGRAVRYFVKPWNHEELGAALEEALRVHAMDARLRELEAALAQGRALAAVGQASASVAHELLNPVTYLSENVRALRRELAQVEGWVRPRLPPAPAPASPEAAVAGVLQDLPALLRDVERGAQHVRQVALGLRAHVRPEPVEAACDLEDVAGYAVKLARGQTRARLQVDVEVDGPPVRVAGDFVRVCQVLVNLLVNGLHALEGTPEPQGAPRLTLRWRAEPERVLLEVEDTGHGIPAALRERVFEPLFTTKPAGQGTGLGLGICRDVLRELGGELTLDSAEGRGTTARVLLRRA